MNSASTSSLITTMMVLALALSRAPRNSSQVISITMPKAGRLTRIGMPSTLGAVFSRLLTSGFELSSAVRYPVVSHTGRSMPTARISELK